tara:strand:- start:10016 stop:10960 length:945 start_codon:yes stop_codon:yes gene_type:complete
MTPPAHSIVVFGSINADLVLPVTRIVTEGETILAASTPQWSLGGKGANQATAARLAGANVTFVGCVGDDDHGLLVERALRNEHVSVRLRRVAEARTGLAVVQVDESGRNAIVVAPGANWHLQSKDATISATDIILTQGEIPASAIDAIAQRSGIQRARFVLNLAPVVPVSSGTLRACDPLIVNEHEARALGIATDAESVEEWLAEATRLRHHTGARSIVITLGAAGVVASDQSGAVFRASRPVAVVDTTGAGDAFVGAYVSELSRGASSSAALHFAAAAAELSVSRPGTVQSYASQDQIRARSGDSPHRSPSAQ